MKMASYVPTLTAAGCSSLFIASCLVACSAGGHSKLSDAGTADGSVHASRDDAGDDGSSPHSDASLDASISESGDASDSGGDDASKPPSCVEANTTCSCPVQGFAGRAYEAPSYGRDFTVEDMDGDKTLDLVIITDSDVEVLLGTGTSFVTSFKKYLSSTDALTVAELNGDGKLDIAVQTDSAQKVAVLLGHGDGTFADPQSYDTDYYTAYASLFGLAAGDIDGDGATDLITSNSLLFNDGHGSFKATPYASSDEALRVSVADLNHDKKFDVITVDSSAAVYLNDAMGGLSKPGYYSAGFQWLSLQLSAVAPGDLDGDGDPDLAVSFWSHLNGTRGGVSVLLNAGDGTFAASVNYESGADVGSVAIGDLNGDKHADLVVSGGGYNDVNTKIFLNRGDGSFADYVPVLFPTDNVVLRDMDGDGSLDLVGYDEGKFLVLANHGDGTFAICP
jgi:hypothetical protein